MVTVKEPRVKVRMGHILSLTVGRDVTHGSLYSVIGVQILDIF